jgi:hypothetical protein
MPIPKDFKTFKWWNMEDMANLNIALKPTLETH